VEPTLPPSDDPEARRLRRELTSFRRAVGDEAVQTLRPAGRSWKDYVQALAGLTARFWRYERRGEIARGGMGVVESVFDPVVGRTLAMKSILPRDGVEGAAIDDFQLALFLQEAQVTGQLDHPSIVTMHDLGVDDKGHLFFTMKQVRGIDLGAAIELAHGGDPEWPAKRVVNVIVRICEAMAYAHSKGVLHRDLKPSNVMVGRFGEVYVMDWGVARVMHELDRRNLKIRDSGETAFLGKVRERGAFASPGGELMTEDGQVVGTPTYMAPEQARGESDAVSPRSDIYSVGAILYHLIASEPPYREGRARATSREIWERVKSGPPLRPPLHLAGATPELADICMKAMERDAEHRYASMLELAADLNRFIAGETVLACRRRGALGFAWYRMRRSRQFARIPVLILVWAFTLWCVIQLVRIVKANL
jgi:serine/threonine protein kinase